MNTFVVQLALYVLSFLEPRDLLRAAQTCRNWRFLSEDNLLWRVKCREASVEMDSQISKRLRHRPPTSSHPPSPWKVSSNARTKYSKVNLFNLSWWTIKIHKPYKNKSWALIFNSQQYINSNLLFIIMFFSPVVLIPAIPSTIFKDIKKFKTNFQHYFCLVISFRSIDLVCKIMKLIKAVCARYCALVGYDLK